MFIETIYSQVTLYRSRHSNYFENATENVKFLIPYINNIIGRDIWAPILLARRSFQATLVIE